MARKSGKSGNQNDIAGSDVSGTDNENDGIGIVIGEPVTVDPLSAVADDTATSGGNGQSDSAGFTPTGRPKRKYGKRNSVGSAPEEKVRVDVLSQLLISSHLMIAAATNTDELKLSEDEAKQVADAYSTLADFYPALQQSPKTLAMVNFVSALGWVYGTRAVAIYNRKKEGDATDLPGIFPHNMKVVQ